MSHTRFLAELETHKKILYKVARVYCREADDRQDLIQDIVVALWRSFEQFDGRSKFSTWMYRVALNVALTWVREQGQARATVALEEDILDSSGIDEASEDMPMELRIFLNQLLEQLSSLDRALILLSLEGHEQSEIAELLGISASNVATRLSRIRQRLRQQISE